MATFDLSIIPQLEHTSVANLKDDINRLLKLAADVRNKMSHEVQQLYDAVARHDMLLFKGVLYHTTAMKVEEDVTTWTWQLVRISPAKQSVIKLDAQVRAKVPVETIDLTPSWGDVGNIVHRLAAGGDADVIVKMKPDIAQAFAMASALKALLPTLTEEQQSLASTVLISELSKQGF